MFSLTSHFNDFSTNDEFFLRATISCGEPNTGPSPGADIYILYSTTPSRAWTTTPVGPVPGRWLGLGAWSLDLRPAGRLLVPGCCCYCRRSSTVYNFFFLIRKEQFVKNCNMIRHYEVVSSQTQVIGPPRNLDLRCQVEQFFFSGHKLTTTDHSNSILETTTQVRAGPSTL